VHLLNLFDLNSKVKPKSMLEADNLEGKEKSISFVIVKSLIVNFDI